MTTADHRVDAVRAAVTAALGGRPVRTVTLIGNGLDHDCYEVDGDLIVRVPKQPDPVATDREARLLDAVAGLATVPVPRPVLRTGDGWLGYRRLAGTALSDLPGPVRHRHATTVAAALGTLLARLHTAPARIWVGLAEPDDQPLDLWRQEAAGYVDALAEVLPPARRAAIGAFLAATPPSRPPQLVFSHNDLGIEHVLVDPDTGAVTGVIDWSDAALVDPAADFGLIYRDLGPEALDAAMGSYRAAGAGAGAGLRRRAEFHGRCRVFEDLAYGVRTGRDRYVDTSLTALAWLFPG
ncbi:MULTISPECIES: phosphotransferase family protein [unclassified Solwaraspora]|uniref:phosphotransferase family protein n=1 Tax=unclassified Solwaraspora TaxID=2627926 RepID=UPI00259B0B5F|nr:aminoglycoside phosphotransferase family protein [Solwaraspora sp. WMMA2056]WJK38540.1 aminoglycoside phosphotransferase family protein [Solwaraspora sp. WMMA2056]